MAKPPDKHFCEVSALKSWQNDFPDKTKIKNVMWSKNPFKVLFFNKAKGSEKKEKIKF